MLNQSEIDLSLYCENIVKTPEGIWVGKTLNRSSAISYSDEAHQINADAQDHSFWFQHRNSCILAIIKKISPTGALFDIGGGTGVVTQMLKRHLYQTVLVEPKNEGVEKAREKHISPIMQGDLVSLEFKKTSLPAIGLFDVIEHIKDDKAFLDEVFALLRRGGRLYLTVPYGQWLWSKEDEAAGHFRRYNLTHLKSLLISTGFEIEYSSPFFCFLILPLFILRRIPYLLRIKRTKNKYSKEINLKSNFILKFLEKIELYFIAKLKRLPLGSSLIVVARK